MRRKIVSLLASLAFAALPAIATADTSPLTASISIVTRLTDRVEGARVKHYLPPASSLLRRVVDQIARAMDTAITGPPICRTTRPKPPASDSPNQVRGAISQSFSTVKPM